MQQYSIYNSYYITIMQENYKCLVNLCDILDRDGYWKEPESYLNSSIFDYLDLYVQGVLIHGAIFSGRLSVSIRSIIAQLTSCNVFDILPETEYSEGIILKAKHIVNGPPIVLQLCSLYDYDKGTNMASVFIDHMMSVLLAFSSMDSKRDRTTLAFVEQYYNKSICFISKEQTDQCLGKRYLFKKISSDQIINMVELKQMSMTLTNGTPYSPVENNLESSANKTEVYHKEADDQMLISLQECISDKNQESKEPQEKLELLLNQLKDLVGLEEVKSQIKSLINLIKVRKLRESFNMPSTEMTYHMVFSGNPGTGKTTVARILAAIYCELGLLSKGTLVETDRSGLVAGYVGQTALKVTEVVKSAIGGVLFIDEAYSLTKQGSANDYGNEAIDTLVKLMEDNRDDLVVIVAGYTDEMRQFLKSNTGLISRFNTFIEFKDYTTTELVDILKSMGDKAGVSYVDEAIFQIQSYLENMEENERRDFGNARGIRNLFEKNLMSQANRIVTIDNPTIQQLSTIELLDVCETVLINGI